MEPDALQGGLWFAEKQLWADNGWSKLNLGDYRKEIVKTEKRKAAKAPASEQLGLGIVEPRPGAQFEPQEKLTNRLQNMSLGATLEIKLRSLIIRFPQTKVSPPR